MDKEFRLKDGLHVAGNAAIVGSITTVDSVQFNLAHNVTNQIGMLDWALDDSTMELGLTPNVTLQVGQEQLYLVKNQSGADIPYGTAVMSVGTVGNSGRILVAPAIANGSVASKRVLGVTTERIVNGEDGFVSYFGKLRGLDTSIWSEGDILYVSPTTPGALSNTQPVAPNNKVTIAYVITKGINNGAIFVRPTFGSAINEDENVHIDSILDGQMLIWNNTTGRFENKTYTGYQANDYNTYTTLSANDYNTYSTLAANDGATLLSARANDYNTFTTLSANDFNTYSTLAANDGATLLTARANDYTTVLAAYSNDGATLLTARSNDGATLLTARANDFSTWSGLNTYINLKANTASPTFTGDVTIADKIVHDGDTNTTIRFPLADTFTVETSGIERLRVDAAGNVGIGTGSPGAKLQTLSSALGGTAGDEQTSTLFTTPDGGNEINFRVKTIRHTTAASWSNTETRIQYDVDGNANKNMWISFYNDSVSTADNIMRFGEGASTEWMRIDNGLLGVGTDIPRSRVHVYGSGQSTANITDAGNQLAFLRVSDSGTTAGSGGGIIFANQQSDDTGAVGMAAIKGFLTNGTSNTIGHLTFSTRNAISDTELTERMRLTSNGNLLIGTTTDSGNKLEVSGTISTTDLIASTAKVTTLKDSSNRTLVIKDSSGTVVWGS